MGPEFLDSQYLPLDVHWNQSTPPFLPMLHPNNYLDFDFRERQTDRNTERQRKKETDIFFYISKGWCCDDASGS